MTKNVDPTRAITEDEPCELVFTFSDYWSNKISLSRLFDRSIANN